MPKTKNSALGRLGSVELKSLDPEVAVTPANAAARKGLMNALRTQAPEAIDDLISRVFPLVEAIAQAKDEGMVWTEDVFHPYAQGPTLVAQKALTAWGKTWNLEAAWVLDLVLRSMLNWAKNPRVLQSRTWQSPAADVRELPAEVPEPPTITLPEFSPSSMAASFYREAVLKLCEEAIEEYVQDVLSAYDGEEKDGKKRWATSTEVKSNPEHYDWLVRYQVRRESYANIARSCETKTSSQTVTEAVKRTAQLAIIKLRAAPRGRPKNTTPRTSGFTPAAAGE